MAMVDANKQATDSALRSYFEYSNSGVEVVEDGLAEVRFGEYLVEVGALAHHQLFSAMMLQDRNPGVRIGECVAALGILPYAVVDALYTQYSQL